jgi:hypothetical protein
MNETDLYCDSLPSDSLRACLKTARGAASRDFGWGQGGEASASPRRAVMAEPTQALGKRPAARRVFAAEAGWLRCSSVPDRCGYAPVVAPRHPAFAAKTAPLGIFRQALRSYADRKPRRGGMFIGSGTLKIISCFSAARRQRHLDRSSSFRRAAEKQKERGGPWPCYKHATPTGFASALQKGAYDCLSKMWAITSPPNIQSQPHNLQT